MSFLSFLADKKQEEEEEAGTCMMGNKFMKIKYLEFLIKY